MIKLGMHRALGFGLFTVLLGSMMMVASAAPTIAAAPATPAVKATVQERWEGIYYVPRHFRQVTPGFPTYTLHVTGSGFVPGATVKLALLDTSNLQVLHRGQISVESLYVGSAIAPLRIPRPEVNLRAGTFEYTATVDSVPQGVPLHLWCQAAGHMDFHEVTRV
jgi:hypothetical protein